MSLPIQIDDLTVRFGRTVALDGLSLAVRPGIICGLLGRNGAGKTTLLSVLAGHRRATAGAVRIDGDDPYEDRRLMSEVCLVRTEGVSDDGLRVGEVFELAESLRPRWDGDLAATLTERFDLALGSKVGELSTGTRSALAVTVGLATRAPLTMFDEPHLGMDAPNRYAFYDALLADYATHPRTIVISTHLIDEAASLFEEVVILDRGRLLLQEGTDDLRARGATLTGPAEAVAAITAGMPVLSERRLSATAEVVVHQRLDDAVRAEARQAGVDVAPLPLQDLFVHLTTDHTTQADAEVVQ